MGLRVIWIEIFEDRDIFMIYQVYKRRRLRGQFECLSPPASGKRSLPRLEVEGQPKHQEYRMSSLKSWTTSWNFREEESLGKKTIQTLLKSGRARVLDRKARDRSMLDEEGKRSRSTVGTDRRWEGSQRGYSTVWSEGPGWQNQKAKGWNFKSPDMARVSCVERLPRRIKSMKRWLGLPIAEFSLTVGRHFTWVVAQKPDCLGF